MGFWGFGGTMIKRQKRLINNPVNLIFNVDFFLNRRVVGIQDGFHVDIDLPAFGGTFEPEYISTTNISQQGYGLTAEIKHESDNKSYALLASPGDTIVLLNKGAGIVHRTPTLQPINRDRYTNPDVRRRVDTFHQSSLTDAELNSDVIMKLNQDLLIPDRRDLIRMTINSASNEPSSNMTEVTHLVPKEIFFSPIDNYVLTINGRKPDNEDHKSALNLLTDYSVGGASKKKRKGSKHRRINKARKRYTKRGQRGGTEPSDFALYAGDDATLQFFEENVLITENPIG